jgi:hypothetical protein
MSISTSNPGQQFREAAAHGDVALMHSLYVNNSLDICEAGPKSGKSAAHQAAEKGHAAALRFLHSLGDSFSSVDKGGFTPMQLATEPECKDVFELVSLGKGALKAADQVFPHKIVVSNREPQQTLDLYAFRQVVTSAIEKKLLNIAKERFSNLFIDYQKAALSNSRLNCWSELSEWMHSHNNSLIHLYENYIILDTAIKMNQRAGACGENSSVSYVFLTGVAKTSFSVDRVGVVDGVAKNHSFVILNRDQNREITDLVGWSKVLIIDSLYGRSFFYENLACVIEPTVDARLLKPESLELLCSSKKASLPETSWKPTKVFAHLQKLTSTIETCAVKRLSELLTPTRPSLNSSVNLEEELPSLSSS